MLKVGDLLSSSHETLCARCAVAMLLCSCLKLGVFTVHRVTRIQTSNLDAFDPQASGHSDMCWWARRTVRRSRTAEPPDVSTGAARLHFNKHWCSISGQLKPLTNTPGTWRPHLTSFDDVVSPVVESLQSFVSRVE